MSLALFGAAAMMAEALPTIVLPTAAAMSHSSVGVSTRYAGLRFLADGQLSKRIFNTSYSNLDGWADPRPTTQGAAFQLRIVTSQGSLTYATNITVNTWVTMSNDIEFGRIQSAVGGAFWEGTVEIRDANTLTVLQSRSGVNLETFRTS